MRKIGSVIRARDLRLIKPPPKRSDDIYHTPEYRRWREAVIARAGRRCQAVVDGQRCAKAEPQHRMFADHIVEIQDDGAPFDIINGRCLCGSHHTEKTAAARAARLAEPSRGAP